MNLLIIHYNTPLLTECLVKSINKFTPGCNIYVFDNSDKYPFTYRQDNIIYLNNTQGQYINFDEWLENFPNRFKSKEGTKQFGSAKHCISVEKCMEIIGENFILLDSDILLKQDISCFYDPEYIFVGTIEQQPSVDIFRVLPFICFINVEFCREHDVHYFDEYRMHGLCNNIKVENADHYDTGAAFYYHAKFFPYKEINYRGYIEHFKGGSWEEVSSKRARRRLTSREWLRMHEELWGYVEHKVVYTCITGGYDLLKKPSCVNPDFDYICFTDQKISSAFWEILPMPKETDGLSNVKKQRYVKINAHKVLPKYNLSVWIDGNVDIKDDLNKYIKENWDKENTVMAVGAHPERDSVYDEVEACAERGKDRLETMNEQVEEYRKEGLPEHFGLPQTCILFRRHQEEGCIKLMEDWWNEVRDKSHRDQLSISYVLWKNSDIRIQYLDKSIFNSKCFLWGIQHRKNHVQYKDLSTKVGIDFESLPIMSNNGTKPIVSPKKNIEIRDRSTTTPLDFKEPTPIIKPLTSVIKKVKAKPKIKKTEKPILGGTVYKDTMLQGPMIVQNIAHKIDKSLLKKPIIEEPEVDLTEEVVDVIIEEKKPAFIVIKPTEVQTPIIQETKPQIDTKPVEIKKPDIVVEKEIVTPIEEPKPETIINENEIKKIEEETKPVEIKKEIKPVEEPKQVEIEKPEPKTAPKVVETKTNEVKKVEPKPAPKVVEAKPMETKKPEPKPVPKVVETKPVEVKKPTTIVQKAVPAIPQTRVLLCAIGKMENNYIREWVEYHKNMGFTNIVLYDNNDFSGEKFTEVINDYIENGFVKIESWRGVKLAQVPAYNNCYEVYKNKYDWICFWDIDEFVVFEKHKNIIDFLDDNRFKKTQCIRLCWKQYTDNGLIDVVDGNYSIKRFTEVFSIDYCKKSNISIDTFAAVNGQCKSIFRTNVNNFLVDSPHCFMKNVPALDATGESCKNDGVYIGTKPVWSVAWLNHYRFKTVGEYITQKMVRLWPTEYGNGGKDILNIDYFFKFNKKTTQKEEFVRKMLNNRGNNKPKPTQNVKSVAPQVQNVPVKEVFDKVRITSWIKRNPATGLLYHSNWGDELNYFIMPLMFNRDGVDYKRDGKENFACIGSILNDVFIDENTIVWGSGTQDTNMKLTKKPKKVCAVRGPLTRQFLLDSGIDCPEIYGDPALLLPRYYSPKIEKKYHIGFIPHWESIESEDAKGFAEKEGVHMIRMRGYKKWTDIIDEILSCDYIISESLHGLIIAEAYGIPNLWGNVTLKKYDIKFHDFFLSMGRDRTRPIKITKDTSTQMMDIYIKSYKAGHINLQPLINACPITVKEIKPIQAPKIEEPQTEIKEVSKEVVKEVVKEKKIKVHSPTRNLILDGAIF